MMWVGPKPYHTWMGYLLRIRVVKLWKTIYIYIYIYFVYGTLKFMAVELNLKMTHFF